MNQKVKLPDVPWNLVHYDVASKNFTALSEGVFIRSTDMGLTWEEINKDDLDAETLKNLEG